MMQVQFLPFHNSFVAWTQRIALAVDLALLAWLWRKVLSGREFGGPFRASWAWPVLGFVLSFAVLLFCVTVVTFPGEWQDNRVAAWPLFPTIDAGGQSIKVSFHDWLFTSEVSPTTRHRWLPFSSTLVLTGLNVHEGLGIDDPKKAK